MTKRVVHQEYLEAWLRGESVEVMLDHGNEGFSGWCTFSLEVFPLSLFNNESCEFRHKLNLVAVDVVKIFRDLENLAYSHVDGVLYLEDVRVFISRHINEDFTVVEK